MALITKFEERPTGNPRLHPTEVTCGYCWFDLNDQKVLQLTTYGSEHRQDVGSSSQTIQLDEKNARQLRKLIEQAFPDS